MGQRLGQITWGGLTFGPGTPYAVAGLEGLDDLPDVRTQDVPRPTQHGDYTGPDYLAARTIGLDLWLIAPDPDTLRTLTLALRDGTQPGTDVAPLVFVDQGVQLSAKVRKRALPYNASALDRVGSASLEFYCPDPVLYSSTLHTAQTAAYSPSAGRTYSKVFPFSYGTQGTSGQLTAVNAGAAPSYPTLRIDGPVANPSVEQTNVGGALQFTGTLAAGDYLTIDTRTRAVVLNGSTPRRSWLAGGATWPLLLPGSNSFVFRGTALAGQPLQQSLLTVSWRDASL